MLYKFKSRSTADIIMLEPNARQILEIIGKSPDDQHGIVTVAQIPAAIQALEAAIAAQEAQSRPAGDKGDDNDDEGDPQAGEGVDLRQRAVPFMDMLRRSAAENNDVVW